MKNFAVVLLLCSLVACGGGKSTSTAATPVEGASNGTITNGSQMENESAGNVPSCGAVKAVWVNTKTHVYHEPGDPMYGHTKHGKYMCPSQAKKEGDRPAGAAKHKTSM
jgi:hypothetical protein